MKSKTKILILPLGLILPYLMLVVYMALTIRGNTMPMWFPYVAICYFVVAVSVFICGRKRIIASSLRNLMIIHKIAFSLVSIVLLALFASPAPAQLQSNAQQAGLQAGTPALRMGRYDKAAEVVDSGSIISISTPKNGSLPRGTYVFLHAGAVTLNVQMGLYAPANIPFAVGDQVQVTRSLMSINGQQVLLARQVQSSSQTLTIRSTHGFVLRPRPSTTFGSIAQGAQQ